MNSADYIKRIQEKTPTGSVYSVAKLMGLPITSVQNYAYGLRQFDDLAAMKVAEILDLDGLAVLADVRASTEKDAKRREFWENLSRKLAGVTVVLVLGCITILAISDFDTSPAQSAWHSAGKETALYAPQVSGNSGHIYSASNGRQWTAVATVAALILWALWNRGQFTRARQAPARRGLF